MERFEDATFYYYGMTKEEEDFLRDLCVELQEAQRKFPPMHSLHEGYAIIKEELDEFWEWCRLSPERREAGKELIREELIQVAAMAWRTAVDCQLG